MFKKKQPTTSEREWSKTRTITDLDDRHRCYMDRVETPQEALVADDEISQLLLSAGLMHESSPPHRKFIEWSQRTDSYGDAFEELRDAPRATADLVSSETINLGTHAPVIDIDLPCRLIPSSTEGHFHLYIDKEMSWPAFEKILVAMTEAGVVQEEYLKMARRRKAAFVRLPEKPKTAAEKEADLLRQRLPLKGSSY